MDEPAGPASRLDGLVLTGPDLRIEHQNETLRAQVEGDLLLVHMDLAEPRTIPIDLKMDYFRTADALTNERLFAFAWWNETMDAPSPYALMYGHSEWTHVSADTPIKDAEWTGMDPQDHVVDLSGRQSMSFEADPITLEAGNWTFMVGIGSAANMTITMPLPMDLGTGAASAANGCRVVTPGDFESAAHAYQLLGPSVVYSATARIDASTGLAAWFDIAMGHGGRATGSVTYADGAREEYEHLTLPGFADAANPVLGRSSGEYTFHVSSAVGLDSLGTTIPYCAW